MATIKLNGVTYPQKKRAVLPGPNGEGQVFDLPEDADKGLNAYSERPVQNKVIHAAVEDLRQRQTSPFNFKGSCTYANLPSSGNAVNDTWYVTNRKYRVTWTGSAWQQSSMDESSYTDDLANTRTALVDATEGLIAAPFAPSYDVVAGGITSYGQILDDAKRCRTGNIAIQRGKTYKVRLTSEDYAISYAWAYSSASSLDATRRLDAATRKDKYVSFTAADNEVYFRVCFYRTDNADITDEDRAAVKASLVMTELTDESLTISGRPADAKAVGDFKANAKAVFGDALDALIAVPFTASYDMAAGGITTYGQILDDPKRCRTGNIAIRRGKTYKVRLTSDDYAISNAWAYSSASTVDATRRLDAATRKDKYVIFTAADNEVYFRVCFYRVDGESITSNDLAAVKSSLVMTELEDTEYRQYGNLLDQSRHSDVTPRANMLTFLFFTDIHAGVEAFGMLKEFVNKHSGQITDVLDGGDLMFMYSAFGVDGTYVLPYDSGTVYDIGSYTERNGGLYRALEQTTGDFDRESWSLIETLDGNSEAYKILNDEMSKDILFCVGNHDTVLRNYNTGTEEFNLRWTGLPIAVARQRYFAHMSGWGVSSPGNGKLYYYKDYSDAKIRLIVLDYQYWDEDEDAWFVSTLNDASANGLAVIVMAHAAPGAITGDTRTPFTQLTTPSTASNNYSVYGNYTGERAAEIINAWDGEFIAWLCGHSHRDRFGHATGCERLTVIQLEQSSNMRDRGTNGHNSSRNLGRFNSVSADVITIDPTAKLIKIFRIGNNVDDHMRKKEMMCFDYANRQLIT